jgi:hypothetical protein
MARTKKTTGRTAKQATTTARPGQVRGRARAVSLEAASPSRQTKLFRAIAMVMEDHGVQGEIAGLILTPAPATESAVPAPRTRAVSACPPGQVKRVVCVRRPNGTVACRTECQPF